MIKRTLHIVLSLWLALLLLFGGTAKEFIHLFTHHTDTVHSINEKGDLVIEPEHHHCSFLEYALPLFINADITEICFSVHKKLYPAYKRINDAQVQIGCVSTAYLRGPPSISTI